MHLEESIYRANFSLQNDQFTDYFLHIITINQITIFFLNINQHPFVKIINDLSIYNLLISYQEKRIYQFVHYGKNFSLLS